MKKYGILDVAKDFATGNIHSVNDDLLKRRVAICNSCPELSAVRTCKKCGCFVDAKARLEKSQCPIGKW